MRILKILLFFCLLLSYTPPSSAQTASLELLVVVYGDGLTSGASLMPGQGFPAQLEKRLESTGFEVNVTYMGEIGLTTSMVLGKMDYLVGQAPDLVILQLGETDLRLGVNPTRFFADLQKIIDALKSKNIYVVVMGAKAPVARGKDYATQIELGFKKIGDKTALYPYTLEGIVGREDLTLGDGYHPNARGVEIMVNGIQRIVDFGLRWRLEVINKWRAQQQTMH